MRLGVDSSIRSAANRAVYELVGSITMLGNSYGTYSIQIYG